MNKLRIKIIASTIVGIGMIFNPCFAYEEDDSENAEIIHLIEYIGDADCTFFRNGAEYKASHAKLFIEYKYDDNKEEINSTEEFIKLSATKSTSSGIGYKVRCNNNETSSANWLAKELAAYRNLMSEKNKTGS